VDGGHDPTVASTSRPGPDQPGLQLFHDADAGTDFDEHRLGLDHIAFGCANRAELESWQAHLDGLGYAHGGIVDAPYGSGLSFRDPDNLPLEFFAPPG
jgi:glyoxylase I family protein